MMKPLFHLPILCLCALSSGIFGQSWYSDPSFLSYYSQSGEVYLETDFSQVDVYLHDEYKSSQLKNLRKSKSFNGYDENEKLISIAFSENTYQDEINVSSLARRLEIEEDEIKEIAPSMRVGGRIKARLQKDFIISTNKNIRSRYLESILKRMEAEVIEERPDGSLIVRMQRIEHGFDLMHELASLGMIEYAQPDMVVKIEHTSDPLFGKQYQLQNTGQYIDGQRITSGVDLNVVPAWNVTKGSGVTIAVLDDGLERHEDLPIIHAGYTPSNEGNGTPESGGKHGMAVAGIISAQHNDLGVKGIAPDANLVSVNIFAQDSKVSDYAKAFYWAVESGADVISNSWGFVYEDVQVESSNPPSYIVRRGAMCSSNPFPALTSAINYAADQGRDGKGCLITFASGNWAQSGPLGQNADECVTYPASLSNVLAIGAVNPNGVRSTYSDFGPKLDFVAPSNDLNSSGSRSYFGVRTIDREGSTGYSQSNYHSGFGGTSAATPAAAGAIALIVAAHPNLTRSEIISLLKSTAKDLSTPGFDNETGYGLIDAGAAIGQTQSSAPVNPCANKNGDSDNDGICNADDCQPNNASYPTSPGITCNDGDASTENDRVTSDGCGCVGTPIPCYYAGGDQDGDGYCVLDDCDDEDASVPATPGRACNDQNTSTENDVIQSDGCTCAGTIIEQETQENDNNNDNSASDESNQETESTPDKEDCLTPINVARNGTAKQSSTFFTFDAGRGIDGDKSNTKYAQTNYSKDPYWSLDLGSLSALSQINVYFKNAPRNPIFLYISKEDITGKSHDQLLNSNDIVIIQLNEVETSIDLAFDAQYIRLHSYGYQSIALIEFEAYGCPISNASVSNQTADVGIPPTNEFNNGLTMKAYPNPAVEDAFVSFENSLGKSGELKIYSTLGELIIHQKMRQIPKIPVHLDLKGLDNGMYLIEMTSDNQRITEKLIINR